jgi:hypothetical protein
MVRSFRERGLRLFSGNKVVVHAGVFARALALWKKASLAHVLRTQLTNFQTNRYARQNGTRDLMLLSNVWREVGQTVFVPEASTNWSQLNIVITCHHQSPPNLGPACGR